MCISSFFCIAAVKFPGFKPSDWLRRHQSKGSAVKVFSEMLNLLLLLLLQLVIVIVNEWQLKPDEGINVLLLLLLVWHAPLGVRSTKHSHQSPEWTILSQDVYFFHGEVFWISGLAG